MSFEHDFDSRRMPCVPSVDETLPTFFASVGVVPGDVKREPCCAPNTVGLAPTV